MSEHMIAHGNGHGNYEDALTGAQVVATTNPLLEGALLAADMGIRVFPLWGIVESRCECGEQECGSPGKHPVKTDWQTRATTSREQIERWWTAQPNRNVGGRTGACSGVWVLDVDPRHGGDESLRGVSRQHGVLLSSVESLTGGGGRHLLWKHPGPEREIPCDNDGKLADGLDVKGDGGYVVLPPSLHVSGARYEWELSGHPTEAQPIPAPGWLLEAVGMRPAGEGEKRIAETRDGIEIKGGRRNDTLASIAGRMRSSGLGEAAILAALLEANASQCKPPLTEDEVRGIAHSVSRYEPDDDGARLVLGGAECPDLTLNAPIGLLNGKQTQNGAKNLIVPTSFSHLAARPPAPRRWVIRPVIPGENMPTLVHAEGGSAKSFLGLYAGLAVSTGEPFLGMPTIQHPVAYLDFELGQAEQERRALAIARGMGMHLLQGDFTYFPVVGYSFKAVRDGVKAWAEQRPGGLLVIDSFGAASTGDTKGEELVIEFMRNLRALGAEAALIIDHQAKYQQGDNYSRKSAYGSVYKENLSRAVWQYEVVDSEPGELKVLMRHKKNSFGTLSEGIGVEIMFDEDAVGDIVQFTQADATTGAWAHKASLPSRIKAALKDRGPSTASELAQYLDAKVESVRPKLSVLKGKGAVIETGEKRNAETVVDVAPAPALEVTKR
jgi:hypothetical protein